MGTPRRFSRSYGDRRYKKMFLIAVEGRVTEKKYFSLFSGNSHIIRITCLTDKNKSAPRSVLKRMKKKLDEINLLKSDEAWLVVDKDEWQDEQLQELFKWSSTKEHYGFACSNPCFELWLLLHFEESKGVSSAKQCKEKLSTHIRDYNKHLPRAQFTKKRIKNAIERAQKKDNPPCTDWPRSSGTTVYKLVEHILQAISDSQAL